MDFQHRVGGKTGSGGVASEAEANRDRRERLRQLALDTIDLNKDPYFMKNHLGTYECKLCLTLHNNEGSYLAHTQGIFILYYILSWFYIRFIWVLLFTYYTEYRFFIDLTLYEWSYVLRVSLSNLVLVSGLNWLVARRTKLAITESSVFFTKLNKISS